MCRNTEKKCMHYENGIKDEKNIWKNLSLTWHNQGITQGTANSLIEVLAKFGEVPDGILQKVQSQKNLEILQDWFKKAIKAESLEEWVKSIKELTQEQTNK